MHCPIPHLAFLHKLKWEVLGLAICELLHVVETFMQQVLDFPKSLFLNTWLERLLSKEWSVEQNLSLRAVLNSSTPLQTGMNEDQWRGSVQAATLHEGQLPQHHPAW